MAMPKKDSNGIDTYDHSNYTAPVHAIIGMAGFSLDKFPNDVSYSQDSPPPTPPRPLKTQSIYKDAYIYHVNFVMRTCSGEKLESIKEIPVWLF